MVTMVVYKPQKAHKFLPSGGHRPFLNCFCLGWYYLYAIRADQLPQKLYLLLEKLTLFGLELQVILLEAKECVFEILKTVFKGLAQDHNIV